MDSSRSPRSRQSKHPTSPHLLVGLPVVAEAEEGGPPLPGGRDSEPGGWLSVKLTERGIDPALRESSKRIAAAREGHKGTQEQEDLALQSEQQKLSSRLVTPWHRQQLKQQQQQRSPSPAWVPESSAASEPPNGAFAAAVPSRAASIHRELLRVEGAMLISLQEAIPEPPAAPAASSPAKAVSSPANATPKRAAPPRSPSSKTQAAPHGGSSRTGAATEAAKMCALGPSSDSFPLSHLT